MEVLSVIAQLIVAISVLVVWVFRFDNIVKEFNNMNSVTDTYDCWSN
jgi:uncharacterized protein YoxC